ncbi:serine/threonine-protein kinase [Sorangium sp. So ce124]|uniref:serine/threonine-protein kinase n=1 Tax=Sorangium sp. So ce124 TaxID=3133280 RepID=UPI003F5EA933
MIRSRDEDEQDADEGGSAIDSLVRDVVHFSEAELCAGEPDRIGARIGGFEIVARVGAGGMGVVYSAEDLERRRKVALKVLPAALVADPQSIRRFTAEAAALASLDHPAVVRYIAHGKTADGEGFLAMEWLDGEDLARRLRRGRLGIQESRAVGLRVAAALAAAHARGIIHRDIKPSNVFLRDGDPEQATILDFGVARLESSALLTASGATIGTPGYMAPEQARGEAHVDARADVFSLGCVLFECLTGEPAFVGVHRMASLARVLFDAPPRARDRRPEVPERLCLLVDRMLAKRPLDRPPDGHAVVEALCALGDRLDAPPAEPPRCGPRAALTGSEQRAVAVVLTRAPELQGERADDHGDAEIMKARADDLLRREARRHGGHFERLVDGSGAVLLTRTALATDLAAQAARCALALRAHGASRVIALAVGQDQAARRSLAGLPIDRAARLVGGSSPGDAAPSLTPVLLDEIAAGLLDARFDVRETERGIVLCGERELGEGTRTLLGKATPFVGRDRELHTLEQLFDECLEERVAQAVLVTAPPGAGKSRLLHEFVRYVHEREGLLSSTALRGPTPLSPPAPAAIWIGRGDERRAGSAFGLLGQVLRCAAGIQDAEPIEVRRQKLLARVGERVAESERRRVAEFLGEIVGAPFPAEESPPLSAARKAPQLMSDQMRRAFLDFLAAECAAGPVHVVLEDLHWGDRPTIELLDQALRDLRDRHLFVVALARPEVRALFPNLWNERRLHEIHLGELTPRAIERLTRHVLGERMSRAVLERLVKLSEGNAFYLEELIRSEAEGRGGDLPETVVAMVQSRLGALDDEARRLLRAASVFGEVFWAEGAASLLGGAEGASRVREQLSELVAREVVVSRGEGRFPGEAEYAFRHSLLREGAHAMLTREDRALGHRLAGEWLEQRGEPDVLVLAAHFERGLEPDRAAWFYSLAADRALDGFDLEGALSHTARGLSCGAEGPTRGALLACEALVHFWRADFEAANRRGVEALPLLAAGGRRWCQLMAAMCLVALQRLPPEEFAARSRALSSVEPTADAQADYVQAASSLAVTWSCAGARNSARDVLARMERICADAALPDASAHGWLKYATSFHGYVLSADPWGTLVASQEAIAWFEEAGDRRMVACTRAGLGVAQAELFGLRAAEETLRAGITAAEQLGDTVSFAYVAMHLSLLLAERGVPERLDEASALATDILNRVPGTTLYGAIACSALARVSLRRGDPVAAEACARRCREALRVMPGMSPPAFVVHIGALLGQKRNAEARAVAEEGLELIRALGGAGSSELRLRLAAAEARAADGDLDAARAAIEAASKELDARAARIADGAARTHFLGQVPSHARIRELARQWRAN